MMLKTTGGRFKQVRELLKLSGAELGKQLRISQGAVSAIEKRDTPIKNKHLNYLHQQHGINPAYIQSGIGEIKTEEQLAKEPEVIYETFDWSEIGVRARFQEQIKEILNSTGIEKQELAKRWDINNTHLSKVMNDLQDVTLSMLIKASRHGKLNLNYTVAKEGGLFIGDESNKDKRIKELEMLVELLKEKAGMNTQPALDKKRA